MNRASLLRPLGQRFHCPVLGGSGSFRLRLCAVQFGAWHCSAADVICTAQDTEALGNMTTIRSYLSLCSLTELTQELFCSFVTLNIVLAHLWSVQ